MRGARNTASYASLYSNFQVPSHIPKRNSLSGLIDLEGSICYQVMASKRTLEELDDQQKVPPTCCNADDAGTGAGGIEGLGDEKESSLVRKKLKAKIIYPGYPDPDLEQLSDWVEHSIKSAEDGSLDDMNELLNKHYPNGCCGDKGDKWFKYLRQLVDSQGFDIDCTPTDDLSMLPIIPQPAAHKSLVDLAKYAINSYNGKEGTNYMFVKVEKANSRLWAGGCNFYLTFQAALGNSNATDRVLNTFRALVYEGFSRKYPEPIVKFCRLKPISD